MKISSLLLLAILCSVMNTRGADDAKAQQLAKDVWKASGGENWPKVKALDFTFIVEQDGKQLAAAEHHWDMATKMDHVKWKDKDATVNVTAPAEDELAKGAYARWTNDSYWLLAPLKLLDPGVKLAYEGTKEMDGAPAEVLHVSFEKVGLTPGDQYRLYIDPQTKLVRSWDYMPKADMLMHGTWEKYQKVGGLNLATEHNFEGKMIRFADVKATTD
jgi:hypothetical protein